MKKNTLLLIFILVLMTLSGCGKTSADQTEIYNKINSLAGDFAPDYISYQVELTAKDKNIVLHNEGSLRPVDDEYIYTYSNQTLNKIGSGADSLISTSTGECRGSKDELWSQGFGLTESAKLLALNLQDSFKSYKITEDGSFYVMTGYIARNTIIKYTEGLDDDIRFNYRLTVNSDITVIEKLEISYVTTNFDSVVITINFKEAER